MQAGNGDHMKLLSDFGITVVGLPDGRVQLLHSYSQAKTTEDAEEGLVFMQEMVEISRNSAAQPDNPPRIVTFQSLQPDGITRDVILKAGPAQFGLDLKDDVKVTARLVVGDPFRMCKDPTDESKLRQKIVIIQRGDCMFIEKARRLQKAGAVGGIVIDNSPSTSADAAPLFAMSGDGTEDVQVCARLLIFLFTLYTMLFTWQASFIFGTDSFGISLFNWCWRSDPSISKQSTDASYISRINSR